MSFTVPFPDCIIDVLIERLILIDGVGRVHNRALTSLDENGSVGVWFSGWTEDEHEIGGRGPSIASYVIGIEHVVKHTDRVEGGKESRKVGRAIRMMLYRDPGTQVSFGQLKHIDSENNLTERFLKLNLNQEYGDTKIDPAFVFVNATSVTIQTDTI